MSSDVASVLNGLVETAKDGAEGFKTAAEKVKTSDLKALFSKYAAQRAGYVRELQAAVSELGEKPAEHGHLTGSLHRGWINLKEALSKNEDKAIIDEAEAGEDAAKKAYAEALQKPLPSNIKALVEKQNAGVLEAHNTVRNLKHGLQQTATV
jgi:uncharacterized protein (TIGR02284 family)